MTENMALGIIGVGVACFWAFCLGRAATRIRMLSWSDVAAVALVGVLPIAMLVAGVEAWPNPFIAAIAFGSAIVIGAVRGRAASH